MAEDVTAAGRTVISKAAVILMTYLNGDVHTLTEIATATGLPLSTAHRLVRELAAWKILERTDDGDYCVGLPLRLIGGAAGAAISLEERACLVLQDLSQALDADVRLGVLGDRDVTYIEKARGRRPVTTFAQHARVPAHATAMGKALLAFSAPALVDMFLGRGLTAYTPFTLTAPDRFRRALAMARLSRLAVARWELEPDRSALAVPVFGPGGRVAAAIEVRVDDPAAELPTVRPALVIAGRSLTRELSAHPDLTGRGPGLRPHPGAAVHPGGVHPGGVHPAAARSGRPAGHRPEAPPHRHRCRTEGERTVTDHVAGSAGGPAGAPGGRAPLDRNLALELVRATEAAAIAASRHLGRGDKEIVDQAAVDAMRPVLNTISMRGVVVIGEGEKDEAPMLYNGEDVGDGTGPEVDFAVDPVDGTTLTAKSLPNALAIVAVSERHTMFDPGPCVYMEKIAVAGDLADVVDLTAPIETNLAHVAKVRGVAVPELIVCILDRPRHDDLVRRVRETGARIKFLLDGDVAGAIMAARPDTNVDVMVGIGGTPEGVLAACALKCVGGAFYGRLAPRNDDERTRALDAGYDLDKVLTLDDMVRSDNVFVAATGVTDGELLHGVRYGQDRATTHSLSMRSRSGAVRLIETIHRISKSNLVS